MNLSLHIYRITFAKTTNWRYSLRESMYTGLETATISSTLPAATSKKLFLPAPPRRGLGSNLPISESTQSSRTQVSCQLE